MQVVLFNPLPYERDVVALVDLEIPRSWKVESATLTSPAQAQVTRQPVTSEKSSVFVDNIWDVPTILSSVRARFYAQFKALPGMGYRVYRVQADRHEPRPPETLVTGAASMENEHLKVEVNGNGTITVINKVTEKVYHQINYLSDQGECGNAWKHVSPTHDRVYNSLGVSARICVTQSGPLVSVIEASFDFEVPQDYGMGLERSDQSVTIPVTVAYCLKAGARRVEVTLTLDNRAKDHWLRVNLPSDIQTDKSVSDSHFDVVERPITLPDSTGWVEQAFGTHPLRSFAGVSDGREGLAVMPKGLYEYEVADDARRTLMLTLIRACRIKLMVSEEKQTELPDRGIQCPGQHVFEYAIAVHEGEWEQAGLLNEATDYAVPIRALLTGRGQGELSHEVSLLTLNNQIVHITAVKQAEDGSGLIVRLFNPSEQKQAVTLCFGRAPTRVTRVRMDESEIEPLAVDGPKVTLQMGAKKIHSLRVSLQ